MKQHSKISAIIVIALSLMASEVIQADQPAAAIGSAAEQSGKRCRSEDGRVQWMEKNLQTLHAALKLSTRQGAAWTAWSDKFKGNPAVWMERRKMFESWSNLPVIERMEKKLAFSRERQAKLEERITATKAFYGSLSPKQRQTFDTQFSFWPHGKGANEPADALPE